MQMWKAKNASHIRTAPTAAEYFNAKPKTTFTQKIGHYLAAEFSLGNTSCSSLTYHSNNSKTALIIGIDSTA